MFTADLEDDTMEVKYKVKPLLIPTDLKHGKEYIVTKEELQRRISKPESLSLTNLQSYLRLRRASTDALKTEFEEFGLHISSVAKNCCKVPNY